MKLSKWICVAVSLTVAASSQGMELLKVITGKIAAKSIVHTGTGLFFAQNMMYEHTITVYDRSYRLVKTISDTVVPAAFGITSIKGKIQGSPVECAVSPDGRYAWISNYQMYGGGFNHPGNDASAGKRGQFDNSFLYRVNTQTLTIDRMIRVGAVPKYVACTPDGRYVLVTNWCSSDLSVVDTTRMKEVRSVHLGRFPRGVVVTPDSKTAYIAIMGSTTLAKLDLTTWKIKVMSGIGQSPRHLCLDAKRNLLYVTLNGEGKIAKVDLNTGKVKAKVATGNAPRSMVLSEDGKTMYVVNYNSSSMSKVRASDLKVIQTLPTRAKPIGITYDEKARRVWVSCYSGAIMVFQD